ncbi:MAG TPA: hypothetical protein PK052_08030 [Anaerohalosphaeraceae bacterium]|nr:hypothetical protein [Anaerohalosphaeraceae bacterium]HOM76841.1 hypothetical protein [Anaerohalosphaeraceae bacterium]
MHTKTDPNAGITKNYRTYLRDSAGVVLKFNRQMAYGKKKKSGIYPAGYTQRAAASSAQNPADYLQLFVRVECLKNQKLPSEFLWKQL